jgi:hypothetical protein
MPAIAWIVVACAAAVMGASLAWGAATGDLLAEGGRLLDMPWGVVTLVEVYVGLTLFACWVFWREASRLRAGAWRLAAALGGNIVSCVYVLLALRDARGDARRFWLGAQSADCASTRTSHGVHE